MDTLGWQGDLTIPLGLGQATRNVTLTFRALLRHIYRRADSWTTWAHREEEYLRRAVLAFFLGVAESVYSAQAVRMTQVTLKQQQLEERRRELRQVLDTVVATVAEGYGETGRTSLDTLGKTIGEVQTQIDQTSALRQQLLTEMRGRPGYDRDLDASLALLNSDLAKLQSDIEEAQATLEHERRQFTALTGDIARLGRAQIANERLSSILVTQCPACLQSIEPPSINTSSSLTCYVCYQPVAENLLSRRLDLEHAALEGDHSELARVVDELTTNLGVLESRRGELALRREGFLRTIEVQRREFVTPLLRDLSSVEQQIGRLKEQHLQLTRLLVTQQIVARLERERQDLERELSNLQTEAAKNRADRGMVVARTNVLAAKLNECAAGLAGGLGGIVSIDPDTFTFYVGSEDWDVGLGNERRVLFLMAYQYGLLSLTGQEGWRYPGLLILDNPFQQDVEPALVESAISLVASLCEANPRLQVLIATRRDLPSLAANRIHFTRTFNPEPRPAEDLR